MQTEDVADTLRRRRLAGYALGALLTAPILTGLAAAIIRWLGWQGGIANETVYLAAFGAIATLLWTVRLIIGDARRAADLFLFHDIVLDDQLTTAAKLKAVLRSWRGFGGVYVALVLITLVYGAALLIAR